MFGEVSTNFKSLNRIEISQLVQVLLNFDWFQGSPLGVGGCGWGLVRGCPHTHAHVCIHLHVHTHTCMYDIIWNSQGFPQWGWPFVWNYHVYHGCMCVHVCACMYMHVHMCGDTPQQPHTLIHPPSTPQSHRSWKYQNSITLELIDIIRLCLKILYLWTFLNSYRL